MIALDLFAGTGWGVACHALGIEEHGVEIMPEARAVRDLNGMSTLYADVWEGLEDAAHAVDELLRTHPEYQATLAAKLVGEGWTFGEIYDLLIASPPCQTFSMAGGGAGRKALDEVLGLIDSKAYRDVAELRAFGERHDPRTALVLTPLAHVYRDAPLFVVFEQVPPVLPVWERCAEEMRAWGYSVWTGIVNAEQYGVPQTRRRAILIARADGVEAKMPTPTHSRYYSRTPDKLDDGVAPWVSMAEALGWGMTERPFVTAGNAVGRAEGIGGSGGKAAVEREKAAGHWADRRPATTIAGDSRVFPPGHKVNADDIRRLGEDEARDRYASRAGVPGRADRGGFQSNNNTSATGERYERDADLPAPTVMSGSRSARIMRSNYSAGGDGTAEERGRTMRPDDEPSLTMTGKPGHWVRPAFTVTGGGSATGGAEPFGRRARAEMPEGASRITVAEASILQSYPAGFRWGAEMPDKKGRVRPITKTKTFLQIGNAVPPLMAEAIIVAAVGRADA